MASGKLSVLTAALLLGASAAQADVAISNKPTSNMDCAGGVCTATAAKAVLNVSDLAAMLAGGDVAVKTGAVAKDINIDQPLTWTSTSKLTLDAQESVQIDKQVAVAGQGALTVVTNDAGGAKSKSKTGEFIIVPERGSVQFWDSTSNLIIDGQQYTLVYDIKTLAADIAANPSGFYALAKPYDASVDGAYNAAPIDPNFSGMVDGLGNAISHFSLSSRQAGAVGLFSILQPGGTVQNFGLIHNNIAAVGFTTLGSFAGVNEGAVKNCWAEGVMKFAAGSEAGGLVGDNEGSLIRSYSNEKMHGNNLGNINIGGITGRNTGSVAAAFALGKLSARSGSFVNVGGLIGSNDANLENAFARNRVANGKKTGSSNFGGVIGENEAAAQIKTAYAAGEMDLKSSIRAGGLVGNDGATPGSIQRSYWDLDMGIGNPSQGAGNIPNDPGITGLTTARLQSKLPRGFDPKIWALDPKINSGFPYLRQLPPK